MLFCYAFYNSPLFLFSFSIIHRWDSQFFVLPLCCGYVSLSALRGCSAFFTLGPPIHKALTWSGSFLSLAHCRQAVSCPWSTGHRHAYWGGAVRSEDSWSRSAKNAYAQWPFTAEHAQYIRQYCTCADICRCISDSTAACTQHSCDGSDYWQLWKLSREGKMDTQDTLVVGFWPTQQQALGDSCPYNTTPLHLKQVCLLGRGFMGTLLAIFLGLPNRGHLSV